MLLPYFYRYKTCKNRSHWFHIACYISKVPILSNMKDFLFWFVFYHLSSVHLFPRQARDQLHSSTTQFPTQTCFIYHSEQHTNTCLLFITTTKNIQNTELWGTLGNHKATINSNDHFRAVRAYHVNTPRSSMVSVRYLCVSKYRGAHPTTTANVTGFNRRPATRRHPWRVKPE